MHIILKERGRSRSAGLYVALVFTALVLGGEMPRAQNPAPPAGPPQNVLELQQGRPFLDDLRSLPANLPAQREHRPDRGEEREEPPLQATGGSQDRVAQTSALASSAPAPAPGSGSGAGSFAGLDFATFGDGWPPDTNGDVGPTYYVQTVNTSVGIFRKSDGVRVTAFSFDTLMSQGNFGNACDTQNFGDPTVVWDPGADRWIISDFAFTLNAGNPVAPYFQCFAVSRTGDPVSGGWNFYALQTSDLFPDYPKVGVWPDALYLTANMFSGNTFKNVRVWALNKAQMYAGTGASAVTFNLPAKVQGVTVFTAIPSTYHTVTGAPPAGRPNFISSIWSSKLARIWKFHVDWNNTANSTLTGPSNVTLPTWGVGATSVPAKNGNALDTLRERLMVQSQYTNLAGVESIWLTHTVANPGNTALTSPRWYQLNVTGGTVVTSAPLQQSTWAPDASVARWMPSLAVDKLGDMALGYSASSSTLFPAIRYAGRLFTDPANTLGQTETSLIEGTASQCCNFSDGTVNNRWGDYSAMTIDPDGCTFWYTTEYFQSPQPTSLGADNWQTRIGSFKYSTCTPNSTTLQGTVTDSVTSNPISGATVTAGSSSTTTDGSGLYVLGSLAPATYNVTASASGYTTASASVVVSAGVTTTQNFALVASTGATTSLAVDPASGTYGGTTTLSATLTSGAAGVSGKSISFSLNGNAVGSASTDSSGIATLSSVSLSGINAGAYPTGAGASFAGDGSYASSSGTNSLTIAKASQTITFGALAGKTYGDPTFTVSATASSGLPVSFGASGNCTIAATTVTITGAGSCTITASQAGNVNYTAAVDVPQTFAIAKANQTITFNPLADKASNDPPFTVSATASSGLVVSFSASGNCTISSTTVTITGAGSCTITASQAGNANYLAAVDVPRTFSIGKASQTITFAALPAKTYGDPPFTVSATASSGLVVSFSASGNCTIAVTTVTITGAGSCTITASQPGDTNYAAALDVPQTFSIAKASQTITFGALAGKTYGDPTFTVSATASSGLVVSFSASGNCTIAATTVLITGAGSCTITASQAGNVNYLAALDVPQTFAIAKASQTIAFGALPGKTYGDPTFAVSATASSGLVVSFSASGNCTIATTTVTITGAGSCTITASQPGDTNYAAAPNVPQTFSIAKANQTITFGPLANKTTVDPPFSVNATASSGLTVTFSASGPCTVSGNTVTITGAGVCTITASQAGDANYNAAPSAPQSFNITTATSGTSPDGTTVPPASQIVDNVGAIWTIGANQVILLNGVQAAGGFGSQILWKNTTIFVLGTDNNFWQWTGSGWVFVGPVPPGGGGTASADGTTVPPAVQIVDNFGSVWTIGAGQVILRNGVQAAGGFGSEILWKNTSIYVLGTGNTWYQWTGAGWTNVGPVQP
jgi:carboxypeptidase family protein